MQALKYLDYIFTGVFTFEMVIKVRRGLPAACTLLTLPRSPLGGVTSWRHRRWALHAHSRARGRPAASHQPWDGSPVPPWSLPCPHRVRPPHPATMGLSPSSALSGARRGGGHGAGRTEPTDHCSGTETALRRARCEAAAQDPPPRRGRHVPSVSAGRPRQRQRVPSGRHGGVVDVHTRASPAAEQLRVPVHVTRGGLARPHRCLLSPWQAPGEVSSRFTDEGAKAQRRYGVRSHSSGVADQAPVKPSSPSSCRRVPSERACPRQLSGGGPSFRL